MRHVEVVGVLLVIALLFFGVVAASGQEPAQARRSSCGIAREIIDDRMVCADVRCAFPLPTGETQIIGALLCAQHRRKEI